MKMFKLKKKYKALCLIMSPNGIAKKGTVMTGKEWKEFLVYDADENFKLMFKEIKKL